MPRRVRKQALLDITLPMRRASWARRMVAAVILGGLFLLPALTTSPYVISIAAVIAVNAALALSVVILMGFAGELSFAYGVLFGTGAYLAWAIDSRTGSPLLGIAVGTLGATVAGLAVAIPAARIRGFQLALATFAMGIAGVDVFAAISGWDGTLDVRRLEIAGQEIGSPSSQLLFWAAVLLAMYLVVLTVSQGPLGRRFLLLKSDDATARSLGVNVAQTRSLAFALSAFILGLLGSFYPSVLGLLQPSSFSFQTVVTLLVTVILGGIAWPEGALLGSVAVVVVGQMVGSTAGLASIIYGSGLVALLALAPRGLLGVFTGREDSTPLHRRLTTDAVREVGMFAVAAQHTRSENRDDAVLIAERLEKRFGKLVAVAGVDLVVAPATITALVGANGAGKSTLLNLMSGFQRPDAGRVLFRRAPGADLRDITWQRPDRIAKLGLIRTFQFPRIVDELSVFDNVKVAAEANRSKDRSVNRTVNEALSLVGLDHISRVGARGLSFGTRKRLDIARVLCLTPRAALFDEPAAGLGAAELPLLASALQALAWRGSAVVVIEHNLEFVRGLSQELIVLDFGEVVARGEPTEVLRSDDVRRAYFGQTSIREDPAATGIARVGDRGR